MTSPVYQPQPPRRRKRSALKRQRIMILILLIVVAMLAGSFAVVYHLTSRSTYRDVDGTKYYIVEKDGVYIMQDADGNELPRTSHSNTYSTAYQTKLGTIVAVDLASGKYTEVAFVSTEGTESLEFSSYTGKFDILMYPMLERESIKSIQVFNENEKDGFAFLQSLRCENADCAYVDLYDLFPKNPQGNPTCPKCGARAYYINFTLDGYPSVTFDDGMFSTLVTCTGYTSTYMRLDQEAVNTYGLGEYGLPQDPADAKRYFIITDTAGNAHKVVIGEEIPSGTGYYAQYVGRPNVYILKELEQTQYSYTLSKVLFSELEAYVTPTVVDTMTNTDYFDVSNFELSTVGKITDELLNDADFDIDTLLSTVISFDYIPLELRTATSTSTIPYKGTGKYKSYAINDFKAEDCLISLQDLTPVRTVKLFDAEENKKDGLYYFAKTYGIGYHLTYTHNVERDKDKNYEPSRWVDHSIWISPLQEKSATYFVYSVPYQMIVEVDRAQLEFLRWDNFTWVSGTMFNDSVAFLQKLEITLPGKAPVVFHVDNTASVEGWSATSATAVPPTDQMTVRVGVNSIDVESFKRFYIALLSSSLGGTASCKQDEREQFIAAAQNAAQDYTYLDADGRLKGPALVIKLSYNSKLNGSGTPFEHTAIFYNYGGGRQSFVVLDGAGDFYVPKTQVDKMANALLAIYTPQDKT